MFCNVSIPILAAAMFVLQKHWMTLFRARSFYFLWHSLLAVLCCKLLKILDFFDNIQSCCSLVLLKLHAKERASTFNQPLPIIFILKPILRGNKKMKVEKIDSGGDIIIRFPLNTSSAHFWKNKHQTSSCLPSPVGVTFASYAGFHTSNQTDAKIDYCFLNLK